MPMSPSGDLQDMIYRRLTSDPAITWPVFDRADPQQALPYIDFGPEDVTEDDDECITGTNHQFQVDLWASEAGMFDLKNMMGAVKTSLHNFDGELTDNALHSIRFVRMTVLQDADGVTYHGVVQFEALIESNIS